MQILGRGQGEIGPDSDHGRAPGTHREQDGSAGDIPAVGAPPVGAADVRSPERDAECAKRALNGEPWIIPTRDGTSDSGVERIDHVSPGESAARAA